jgi:GTPase
MGKKGNNILHSLQKRRESVVLVGLYTGRSQAQRDEFQRSISELASLAKAAKANVVAVLEQGRSAPDPAFWIGRGKAEELRDFCKQHTVDTLIFDDELSGSQIRNIERITRCKVIDRTFLILDIFARRARSREGKLQVELAQQQYRLSRLIGLGQALSRLGGGIGTRGPGETKLESDRRHINRRIAYLRRALAGVAEKRGRLRKRRHAREKQVIAVVGYTNAGKSTLINTLCASDLTAVDQPFATLDPSVRRLTFDQGQSILLVDTVGFIRRLPHHLIDAFQATLEEVSEADAILEVIDASDPDVSTKKTVVDQLLHQLGANTQPRFFVFNKIDQLADGTVFPEKEERTDSPRGDQSDLHQAIRDVHGRSSFFVSAQNGTGIDRLKQALEDYVTAQMLALSLFIPYAETARMDMIARYGSIDQVEYREKGIYARIHIPYHYFDPLKPFLSLAESAEER